MLCARAIQRWAEDEEFRNRVCAKIDSMISASIPLFMQYAEVQHLADNKASPHNRTSKKRIRMIDILIMHDVDNEADVRVMLDKDASCVNAAVNYHRHTFTCTKHSK